MQPTCTYMYLYRSQGRISSKSSRDHASLSHLLCRLGRLPGAKVPKKNLYAWLMTIFKGRLVTAACMELGLDGPDSGLARQQDRFVWLISLRKL